MIKEMDIRKLVKSLIVKNLLYEIGLKDTIVLKISQEETENLFLTKLPTTSENCVRIIETKRTTHYE
jgi:hypothetical protein